MYIVLTCLQQLHVIHARRLAVGHARDGRELDGFALTHNAERLGFTEIRTATTEKPVCDTRAAGVGVRSCAPVNTPVRESPAMLRRPAIGIVWCVTVGAGASDARESKLSTRLPLFGFLDSLGSFP